MTVEPLSGASAAVREMLGGELDEIRQDFRDGVADGFFAVQNASPVDTHRFQASHRLALGEASGYVEPDGSTHPLPGQEHIDAVFAQAGEGDISVVHESNLPYSARLAYDGWSQQAPESEWIENSYEASMDARFGGGE